MPILAGVYAATPINRSEVPQTLLNIERKVRSNPFSWRGQFSPQLVQAFIDRYAKSNCTVLDPFLGSGTVLLEAGSAGLTAYGTEINPAAVALASAYQFINIPIQARRDCISGLNTQLSKVLSNGSPLLRNLEYQVGEDAIKIGLIDLEASLDDELKRSLIRTLIVILDFYKPISPLHKFIERWRTLANLVLNLPFSGRPIKVCHADARHIPLLDSLADLVVTSPPYINVFNYHQQFRASVEALNWNLLDVAKSEVGSNRKHRSNRFLTVIQYCLDIAQTLDELIRVCKNDARLIFVVGRESAVRGMPFFNGEIVTEVAYRALGFTLTLRQERVFVNRFGQKIYEDILHLSPPMRSTNGSTLERARSVAQDVLLNVQQEAPSKVTNDLEAALAEMCNVRPSPIYQKPQNECRDMEWAASC